MDKHTYHDRNRSCPDCNYMGDLSFVEVPPSIRTYSANGETYSDHFGATRDYECRNCGAAFTLTDWEDARG